MDESPKYEAGFIAGSWERQGCWLDEEEKSAVPPRQVTTPKYEVAKGESNKGIGFTVH